MRDRVKREGNELGRVRKETRGEREKGYIEDERGTVRGVGETE